MVHPRLSCPTLWPTNPPALGALGYDPSYYYHDYSTAQIWIGRTQQTVGWVVDADLYRKIWGELDRGCPDNSNDHWGGQDRGLCRNPGGLGFATKCLINPPFGHGDCKSSTYSPPLLFLCLHLG